MKHSKAILATVFIFLTSILVAQQTKSLKEKSTQQASMSITVSGSFKMQDFGVINDYMKVISDSFNLSAPLYFGDNFNSYGIGLGFKNPVVETEISVDYMQLTTNQSNTTGTEATLRNSAFTYGLGFNFYPAKFFFAGTTLSVSNHKLKSTINVGSSDIEKANRLLTNPEDNPFAGFSFNLRLQAGLFIPFTRRELGAGLRIVPYYDLSSKYDFTKKIDGIVLQSYSGSTKMPGSGFGIKASLVIMLKQYDEGGKKIQK
jgi:hypothetical protein